MSTTTPPQGVPTLTEVVDWPSAETVPMPLEPSAEAMPLEVDVMGDAIKAVVGPSMTDEQIIQRVLDDLQHQVDLMLDYRLREILAPILTRAADSIVRDARAELALTLRDVVTRAVAQELARHRGT